MSLTHNIPWVENSQIDHIISPYAGTKRSGEIQGKIYSHLYGIRFIALRLFTVFGPKQRPDLAIHKFSKLILQNKPIDVFNHGKHTRDFTYIDDIVDGIINALDNDNPSILGSSPGSCIILPPIFNILFVSP